MSNSTCIPVSVVDVQGDNRWHSVHERHIEEAKRQKPKLVFIGDSMIKYMNDTETWDSLFKPMHASNFGIGGDCTQHVLWRLQNGILDSVDPDIFVVLVGTNNWMNTAEEVVEGIEAIAWAISSTKPNAHIIILGLLPRGKKPNKLREQNYQVNISLEKIIPVIPNCHYLDIDFGVVRGDNTISAEFMTDYLHLNRKGNTEVCKRISETIHKIQTGR